MAEGSSEKGSISMKNCPYCHGTGFDRPGHVCRCITGERDKMPEGIDALRDLFGGAFKDIWRDEEGRK